MLERGFYITILKAFHLRNVGIIQVKILSDFCGIRVEIFRSNLKIMLKDASNLSVLFTIRHLV
jgi:hypothetical protein